MNKKPSFWQRLFWSLSYGARVEVFNNGKPTTETVLHYKDMYIHILEGDDDYSIAWSYQPPAHLPVREIIEIAH